MVNARSAPRRQPGHLRRSRRGPRRPPVLCSCIDTVKMLLASVAVDESGGIGLTERPVAWRPTVVCSCTTSTRPRQAAVVEVGTGTVGGAPERSASP